MLSSQLAHEPHGWLLQALASSSGAPKTTANGADAKKLAALEKRVKRLEDRRSGGARTALRAARAATDCVATRWVPDDYYGRSMRDRSKLLNCDVRQMCKSMLLENKQWRGTDEFDPANARFYLVVVQYAATFDAGRLRSALVERTKLPAKAFNFRVADEADNDRLSGFKHNAVTPFGFAESRAVWKSTSRRRVDGVEDDATMISTQVAGARRSFRSGVENGVYLDGRGPRGLQIGRAC